MVLTTAEKVIMHMSQEFRFQAQRVIKGVYKKHSFFFAQQQSPQKKCASQYITSDLRLEIFSKTSQHSI